MEIPAPKDRASILYAGNLLLKIFRGTNSKVKELSVDFWNRNGAPLQASKLFNAVTMGSLETFQTASLSHASLRTFIPRHRRKLDKLVLLGGSCPSSPVIPCPLSSASGLKIKSLECPSHCARYIAVENPIQFVTLKLETAPDKVPYDEDVLTQVAEISKEELKFVKMLVPSFDGSVFLRLIAANSNFRRLILVQYDASTAIDPVSVLPHFLAGKLDSLVF